MKSSPALLRFMTLFLLMILILCPRPIVGGLDMKAARAFASSGNHAGSSNAYASAAQRLPWMPGFWEDAGEQALLNNDFGNSINFFRLAVSKGSISKRGWLDLGKALQLNGDNSAAINAWEKALPLSDAYASLAQTLKEEGDFPGAIKDWEADLVQEPSNANGHYQLGLLLTAIEPVQALPELMKAAQLDPNFQKPVQQLRSALNIAFLSQDLAYQFLVAGQTLAALGQWDLANEAIHNALLVDPHYPEAWAWSGLSKQHLGLDGSNDFSQALRLDPGAASIMGLYGIYLQQLGKPDEALVTYQKASILQPDDPAWLIGLGSAYEQTGDLVSAYAKYSQAVNLAPQDPASWRALAAFSVNNIVDVDISGLPAARKLVELAPDDWVSYDLEGQASFLLDDYKAAEGYLKKAIRLDPTQAAPALHLGLVYLQSGVQPSAYSYLVLAKTFDPNGPYGWQAERLLEQYFP